MASKCSTVTRPAAKAPSDQRGQGDHHGEAREHRAHDEVRGENGLLPAGHQAGSKVEPDDAVHRQTNGTASAAMARYNELCRIQVRAEPFQPRASAPYISCPALVGARSRSVARSGSNPTYQNMTLTAGN